ncbi:hypothetical protein FRB96_006659 [Tulasnella sp. 330]|nr:hypothetical protein FRB96_006659 [Tulasnella sp. 330]KAG8888441.1 hypothetical protein FRB98_007653 [Tulasnella sp. 332]
MESPPAAKRRKLAEVVTPSASSRDKRPTGWITPSFTETNAPNASTSKLKPIKQVTAFKAPSFHINPPPVGSSTTPLITPKRPLRPISDPNRLFKPPDHLLSNSVVGSSSSPRASPPLQSRLVSSLSDQFKLPKTTLSTPIKDLKPLNHPSPSSKLLRITPVSPRVPLFNAKPLTATPLTTRLATITTTRSRVTLKPESDDARSDDLAGIDVDGQNRRSIIANQAREQLIKMEMDEGAASRYWSNSASRSEDDASGSVESMRGMAISPEKPDRAGKRRGFVRNGLAERASHLISRSQQEFLLWSHDVGRTLLNSAPSSRTPLHDLRISILGILTARFKETTETLQSYYPFPPLPPPYALARCKVTGTAGLEVNGRDVQKVLILFAYSTMTATSTAAAASGLSTMMGLEEGREVLLWRPWFQVEMPLALNGDVSSPDNPPMLLCTRFLVTGRPQNVS